MEEEREGGREGGRKRGREGGSSQDQGGAGHQLPKFTFSLCDFFFSLHFLTCAQDFQ